MWSANTYALYPMGRAARALGASCATSFAGKVRAVSGMKTRTLAALMILMFWGVIALLSFSSSVLNDSLTTAPHLPLIAPFLVAASNAAIWAALTPLVFWLTARCSLERPGRLSSVLLLMAIGLVISIGVGRLMAFIRFQQAMHYAVPGVVIEAYGAARPTTTAGRLFFLNEFEFY